uniref:Syndecan n=1 Tax=Parastrongyloides trichosuri TaxID=131310 RepID=A0A0N4ZXJ2_PARTI
MKFISFFITLLLITGLFVVGEIKNGNGLNKKAALSGKVNNNDIEIEGSGKEMISHGSDNKKLNPSIDTEVEGSAISTDDEDGDVVEEGSGYVPQQEVVSDKKDPISTQHHDTHDKSTTDIVIGTSTPTAKVTTTTEVSTKKDVFIDEPSKDIETTTSKLPKEVIHEIHPDDDDMDDDDDDDEDAEDDIKIDNIMVEDPIISGTSTRPTTTTTIQKEVITEKPYVKTKSTSRPEVIKTTSPTLIYDDIEQFFASIHVLTKPGFLAVIVGGLVIGILIVILFIMFIIYRMRKKDEGSYALDEPSQPPHYSYAYQKAPTKEFYA